MFHKTYKNFTWFEDQMKEHKIAVIDIDKLFLKNIDEEKRQVVELAKEFALIYNPLSDDYIWEGYNTKDNYVMRLRYVVVNKRSCISLQCAGVIEPDMMFGTVNFYFPWNMGKVRKHLTKLRNQYRESMEKRKMEDIEDMF